MSRLLRMIRWIENIIAGGALIVITVSIFLGVIYRYVLNNPLIWSEELSLTCFVWMTFVGSSIVLRERDHIQLDLTKLIKNQRFQRGIEFIGSLAVLFILGALILYGFKQVAFATDKTTALQLPWKYVFLAIPVGSILMMVRMIEKLVVNYLPVFKARKEDKRTWSA